MKDYLEERLAAALLVQRRAKAGFYNPAFNDKKLAEAQANIVHYTRLLATYCSKTTESTRIAAE